MKFPEYGYCAVTADFLHIGHIEFLRECRKFLDPKHGKLIVGIMSDEEVKGRKKRLPIMNQYERAEVVRCVKYVSGVMIQDTFDFSHSVMRLKKFYGDDFIIMDSDENAKKRSGADIIIPGGINRKHGITSKQKAKSPDNS
jgi:cytidyltransferase-like protein